MTLPSEPPTTPPQPGHAGQVPDHPKAMTVMVVGLISLIGGVMLALPLLAGPWAWYAGAKTKREIDAAPHAYGGSSYAVTGMVTGIIATVLLALIILVVVGLAVLAFVFWSASSESTATG
jgi:hypothetical protein